MIRLMRNEYYFGNYRLIKSDQEDRLSGNIRMKANYQLMMAEISMIGADDTPIIA